MPKEIIAVYQDCVLCGDRGRQKIVEFAKKGLDIRKVSFTTEEGRELCHKAVFTHSIESMPFYTDGSLFSVSLDSFLEKKPAKKAKKNKKQVKESEDGLDAEN
ncbi:hypothetical protein IKG38_03540 [Candidatus Saccharibacteria bacterium]|nr:hypothetical protein [Candidatus Saccharibacteria bacterium]